MNYCLDILENATETQKTFDLSAFEKYMLLEDTYIKPYETEQCAQLPTSPDCQGGQSLTNARPSEGWSLTSPDCQGGRSLTNARPPEGWSLTEPDVESSASFNPEVSALTAKNSVPKRFIPRQQNSLFWCFFTAHYGLKEYEMIGTRHQNAELDEKYRISEALEKSPGALKSTNYSLSKQSIKEVCAAIVSSTRDDFFSLIAFCAYYKTRTLVVFEESRTYLEFDCGQSESTNMIMYATRYKNKGNGQWTFSLALDIDDINRIETEYVMLNTYVKPLKGISSYKSDELVIMAEKMRIKVEKKDGKKELYEKIGKQIGTI